MASCRNGCFPISTATRIFMWSPRFTRVKAWRSWRQRRPVCRRWERPSDSSQRSRQWPLGVSEPEMPAPSQTRCASSSWTGLRASRWAPQRSGGPSITTRAGRLCSSSRSTARYGLNRPGSQALGLWISQTNDALSERELPAVIVIRGRVPPAREVAQHGLRKRRRAVILTRREPAREDARYVFDAAAKARSKPRSVPLAYPVLPPRLGPLFGARGQRRPRGTVGGKHRQVSVRGRRLGPHGFAIPLRRGAVVLEDDLRRWIDCFYLPNEGKRLFDLVLGVLGAPENERKLWHDAVLSTSRGHFQCVLDARAFLHPIEYLVA